MAFAPHDPSRPLNSQTSRPSSPPYTPKDRKWELDMAAPADQDQLIPEAALPPLANGGTAGGYPHARSGSRSPAGGKERQGFKESFIASGSDGSGAAGLGIAASGGGLGVGGEQAHYQPSAAGAHGSTALSHAAASSRAAYAMGASPDTSFKPGFDGPSPSLSSSTSKAYGPNGGHQASSYHPLSQAGQGQHQQQPAQKSFWDSEVFWLGLYFFFNLGLTLFNKIVLVSFPFPYTLTGLHALSGCAGSYIALERGNFTPAHLSPSDNLKLAAFSVLYTINIAISNVSLQLVTVPFHQVVRASTPLFAIFIGVLFLRQTFSMRKLGTLLIVVGGVGFATYGEYGFTAMGLFLTLLGAFLAAMKTVVTNQIQTGGIKLHPLDLLMRMSPLAFIQCVVFGWWGGELERVRRYGALEMDKTKAFALLINGCIAFGLNVVSFTANKKTSALTMTVAANVKQVLTIVLAVIIFDLTITPTNGLGIMLTLVGGALYAYIEYQEKQKKTRRLTEKF